MSILGEKIFVIDAVQSFKITFSKTSSEGFWISVRTEFKTVCEKATIKFNYDFQRRTYTNMVFRH